MTDTPPETKPPRASLLRSSFTYSALTLVSRVLGLARDLVLTPKLGASNNIMGDAYNTALWLPNLFRRIFAEGAFGAAFVPAYARKLAGEGEAAADQLATDALATVAAFAVGLSLLFMAGMPWLMYVLRPGFADDPAKYRLAVILTEITMMYLPCMAVASLFSGVLNARGRFIISGAYPTVLNIVMLAFVLPFSDNLTVAYAAAIAVIVAGVGQAALVAWGARKAGAKIHFRLPRLTPDVKVLLRRAAPSAFANSATQINLAVSGILASMVPGMVTWMSVADRLYQLPMSMVGVALGIALLPRLSQSLQAGDAEDVQQAMDQALVFGLAFCLPAAAALMAVPAFLIDGFFTRGDFLHEDALASGAVLFHYAWGVPAFVLQRILQPVFFAHQDTRTPMNFSLIQVVVNIVLGIILFYTIGYPGIPIATSAAAWLTVVQLWLTLLKRGHYRPTAGALFKITRVLAASIVLGAILAVANAYRDQLAVLLWRKEIAVIAVCILGGALYPVLLFAFGGVTPSEMKTMMKRRPKAPA